MPTELARAGGAGHQQVRHPCQVGHHRVAGDVLAQRHGQRGSALGIDLQAEDLGQPYG
jgi:hypothetical protein